MTWWITLTWKSAERQAENAYFGSTRRKGSGSPSFLFTAENERAKKQNAQTNKTAYLIDETQIGFKLSYRLVYFEDDFRGGQ